MAFSTEAGYTQPLSKEDLDLILNQSFWAMDDIPKAKVISAVQCLVAELRAAQTAIQGVRNCEGHVLKGVVYVKADDLAAVLGSEEGLDD